jgi:hypothetical protein
VPTHIHLKIHSRGPTQRTAKLDPYSSALSFDGWTQRFERPANYTPLPVSPPVTRLLASDWARFGRIDPFEAPGPLAFVARTR